MLGLGKPTPVAEHEARGEIERVYHEIRQTLRVSGVNLNFRTWAAYGDFLPLMWDALRPNLETLHFQQTADRVREAAAGAAQPFVPLAARRAADLGESQAYHVLASLDLYHDVNPKLLVLTSAVLMSLEGEQIAGSKEPTTQIARGVPPTMAPMEMEDEKPDDGDLEAIFGDIRETLSLPSINSDYRTLALWPTYLEQMWQRLKPIVQREEYLQAADRLRELSRSLASGLPHPVPLDRAAVEEAGGEADTLIELTRRFEQLLPGLIINISLCLSDWRSGEALAESPFPAPERSPDQRSLS